MNSVESIRMKRFNFSKILSPILYTSASDLDLVFLMHKVQIIHSRWLLIFARSSPFVGLEDFISFDNIVIDSLFGLQHNVCAGKSYLSHVCCRAKVGRFSYSDVTSKISTSSYWRRLVGREAVCPFGTGGCWWNVH